MLEYELQNVFVLQGIPTVTFVEPIEYPSLLVALKTAGRSIVIEGPSGIGKTTAVLKAIEEAGLSGKVLSLSARKKEDLDIITELEKQLPLGIVVVDDFHRLEAKTKLELADLMKTLADESDPHSKLIVLGIPNTGHSLISFGPDLANRIEIIQFEANPDSKVEELLLKGETALNTRLNIKLEIVEGARGSFYIAQMLAHHACLKSGVMKNLLDEQVTAISYESIKAILMKNFSRTFHAVTISFCRGTKLRKEGRAPYLHLLYWLSLSANGVINADREADVHTAQKISVSQVVTKGFLAELVGGSDDIQKVLHFDKVNGTLVAQDPQFIFYIRNISWQQLAEEVGFLSMEFKSKYDFALSFSGTDRPIAEKLFGSLQAEEMSVFYDNNEQHRILAEDVEEYLAPIYSSDSTLVICIIGLDYPKRVWTKFESKQFKDRFSKGAVIPIFVDSAEPSAFDEAGKVGYLIWDSKISDDEQVIKITSQLVAKCGEKRKAISAIRAM